MVVLSGHFVSNFENLMNYFAAGILPLSLEDEEFLLNVRSENVRSYPHKISLWGGMKEDYDNGPKETALREFREESNYEGGFLDVRKIDDDAYVSYLGLIDEKFEVNLTSESENFHWMTLDEIFELNDNRFHPDFLDTLETSESYLRRVIEKIQ